jgi:AraC-like DNA-binding protein/CheY-like chemotaxis protein
LDTPPLVWADLRTRPFTTDLHNQVPSKYNVRYVREPGEISRVIANSRAAAICFEYDEPSPKQLEPLERTRVEQPELPVLMLTVEHSEELAVWALRMRVWDYVVLPMDRRDLAARIAMLVASRATSSPSPEVIGKGIRSFVSRSVRPENTDSCKKLLPAISYVEANYSEKVALGVVARLCGLGRYQFSRIFKRVHGTTFREFLITHRINKAVHMLGLPGASITDVAFAVGFNDLSHFAQMFRRYRGVCPSDYLQEMRTGRD